MLSHAEAEAFVKRHWALAHKLISSRAQWTWPSERDSVMSDGMLALWEAAKTYDSTKVREEPHVLHTISWRMIDLYRNRNHLNSKATRRELPVYIEDEMVDKIQDPSDSIEELLNSLAVKQILEALPPRHRYMLTAHFLEGRTLVDIGKQFGVTGSRASQKLTEAVKAARNLEGMF